MIDRGAIPGGKSEKETCLDGMATVLNKLSQEIDSHDYTVEDIKSVIKNMIADIKVINDEE